MALPIKEHTASYRKKNSALFGFTTCCHAASGHTHFFCSSPTNTMDLYPDEAAAAAAAAEGQHEVVTTT